MTKTVINRFDAQRMRGTTSFGFYLPEKDKLVHNVKESRIKALLNKTKGENQEVLFHHRLSTSTADVRNACHPFSTKETFDYEYIGVHNGMVTNSYVLRSDHEKLGIEYVSTQPPEREGSTYCKFNDSEALIYDLARYFEGQVDKVTAYGTIAFIVIRVDSTGKARKLFFGTNRKSLVMKRTKNSLIVSSEGSGEAVPDNVLHMFDYDTKELTTQKMEIPSNYPQSAHSHYKPTPVTGSGNTHRSTATELDDEELGRRWANSYEQSSSQYSEDIARGYLGRSAGTGDNEPQGGITKEERDELIKELQEMDDGDNDDVKEYFGFAEGDFVVLQGNRRSLKKRFLQTHGSHSKALAACREKLAEAISEQVRLDNLDVKDNEEDEFLDYYAVVHEYANHLSRISDELKKEAQSIEDTKERRADRVMGFHAPSQTLTTTSTKLTA